MKKYFLMACLCGLTCCAVSAAELSKNGEYVLTDFGDTANAKAAQETMNKACQWIIDNGGGILIVPPAVTAPLEIRNTCQKNREGGPAVTIYDMRKGYETCYLPTVGQLNSDGAGWAGQHLNRLINMKGHGLPFSGCYQMHTSYNAVIRGAASNAGAPNLYNFENYTWDGHERPLKYVIAPGALAYDIGDAWKDVVNGIVNQNDPRTLRVVPNSDRDTEFGFAAEDPIEQAIGADPSIPVPVRVRCFNGLPDTMEAAGVDLINNGKVAMHSGIAISSGCSNRDDLNKRKDRKAPWITALTVGSVTENAVVFGADVTNSALLFSQINAHEQPIKWKHDKGETSLIVDPKSGDMSIKGSSLTVAAAKGLNGISGTNVAANNLRQINGTVPAGAKTLTVKFEHPEADIQYAILTKCSWITRDAVAEKTTDGFTVIFETPAPSKGGTIDWFLVR